MDRCDGCWRKDWHRSARANDTRLGADGARVHGRCFRRIAALSPIPAITYLWNGSPLVFAVVGAAFLAVTGGEAMYADMGHFGRFPIRAVVRRRFACAHAQLLRSRRIIADTAGGS